MASIMVQHCLLRADSPIYYATREIGRLHETGDHIHNFALTYALGLANAPYHAATMRPNYQAELGEVSVREVYVTPATPRRVEHTISTIKFGRETWQETKFKNKNIPDYGRIKELAPGSEFDFFVFAPDIITLPKWIRLGIWQSKCEVQILNQANLSLVQAHQYIYPYALNPLDLAVQPMSYDIIAMPPNSLIRHASLQGEAWRGNLGNGEIIFPAHMRYLQAHQ